MPSNAILVPEPSRLGLSNVVLTARGRRHSVRDFPGPLSIKTVIDGRVAWKAQGRELWVDGSSFLVLNGGEPYSMEIDEHRPVTTCCVFFARGFVESVARDLSRSGRRLLDDPVEAGSPVTFLSCLHPRDEHVVPAMRAIRHRVLEEHSLPNWKSGTCSWLAICCWSMRKCGDKSLVFRRPALLRERSYCAA